MSLSEGVSEMSRVGSLNTAVVKWFNPQKRYGFLLKEDGTEIFFHYNDGQNMIAVGDHLEWSLPPSGKRLPDPVPGDAVVYEISPGSKGPKASPWTSKTVYKYAKKRIVEPVLYRIIIQYSTAGGSEEPQLAWEGTNLKDQALEQVWSSNPAWDRSTFSCGDFDSRKWFERQEGDRWVECSDPRVR